MMLPRSRKTFDYTWSRPLEYFNSHNRYPRYRRTAALDGGRFCWQFVGKNAHELYFVLLRAPSKNDREWLRSKEARINRCTTHPVDKSTARSVNRWWEIVVVEKKAKAISSRTKQTRSHGEKIETLTSFHQLRTFFSSVIIVHGIFPSDTFDRKWKLENFNLVSSQRFFS